MSAPTFSVAVRNKEGVANLFRVTHSDVHSHEQVLALVKAEIPNAQVVLVSVN